VGQLLKPGKKIVEPKPQPTGRSMERVGGVVGSRLLQASLRL